ncbi:uncharacterized protein LOC117550788 isoform X1 [Gymnodraco acuticeps]|uniref:Uncharacterized protein LOC117550788 isoform X1 n=1 Tax=Gymnodraco acuticeps TaxID=8218 RepID=A0A6P8UP27_GYMAC|nr:uncharacterized protein LOC117550788 isoform X1 [Gymnodraco acuticeps]
MATYEVPSDKQIAELFIMAFVLGLAAMISYFFTDQEAEEEKREQLWLSQKQAFYWFLDAVAGSLANGLNAPLQYVTDFLHATGIKVDLPVNPVTPDGVFFVVQWVLLLLICYAVIALAFVMFTFFLRKLWWLLKVALALACFGIILNDHSIDTKTMVFRVMCLGCICILFAIRSWRDWTMAARIIYLEGQVKILENQVKETDLWRRRCLILGCCLIGLLCFMFSMVRLIYVVLSN